MDNQVVVWTEVWIRNQRLLTEFNTLNPFTSMAATLINCLAGSLQIAGTVKTQNISSNLTSLSLQRASKACLLKNPMDSRKIFLNGSPFFPVSSLIFIFPLKTCKSFRLEVTNLKTNWKVESWKSLCLKMMYYYLKIIISKGHVHSLSIG